jgi:hypothetical protein
MPPRGALAAALSLVLLLLSGRASAWQEAHETGDDAVVVVDASGVAEVQHAIKWHVVRGPLKSIDLVHVDPAGTLEPDVTVAAEDGRTILAHASRRDDRTVRITVDEPRALMRGNFVFGFRYRLDLVATHALVRDGSTWRLTWSAPVATDGFDASRTVLDFATAPDAPRAILADTGAVDDAAVVNLVREPGHDRLELVRPHVARGEAPTWTVRVDGQALAGIPDPRGRAAVEASAPPEPDRIREASMITGLGALALLFGLLVRRRTRAYTETCAAREATPRSLLPLPDGLRAALAGLALSGAVGLEIAGQATAGAALIAVAVLAAALRAPYRAPKARGPGKWLALRPEDAFASAPPTWKRDVLVVGLGLVVAGTLGYFSRRFDPEAPWIVAIDTAPWLSLIVTGRTSQLPPHGVRSAASWLARVFRALQRVPDLRVSPWARMPAEAGEPDELRLLVLPRAAIPGVLGIELGLGWSATPVGSAGTPEVLARVLDGSPAAARLSKELPGSRPVPGRRPDERVLRLLPRTPTRAATVALSRSLAEALTDRRGPAPALWSAAERRIARPRVAPIPAGAAA